jgi:Tfp pilus assembly protein PilO
MLRVTRDNLILTGVVAAIVVAATVLVYAPQTRTLGRLQDKVAAQDLLLAQDAQRASSVPDLARQVEQLRSRYKDFDRRLPKSKELGGFLREISNNLAKERLEDLVINPGNPTREELFHTYPIVMRFRGSYLSLAAFLQRVGEMERATRIQNLKISRVGDDAALNIELQLNIYFTES